MSCNIIAYYCQTLVKLRLNCKWIDTDCDFQNQLSLKNSTKKAEPIGLEILRYI